MAIPAKGSRRITVGGQRYTWVATGNDGWIDLIICASTGNGQKLTTGFKYYQTLIPKVDGGYRIVPGSQFIITPAVVKEVILYGLAQGWHPLEKGANMGVGPTDEVIEAVRNFLEAKPDTFFEQPVFL